MKREFLVVLLALLMSVLAGCDTISPFIGEDLKVAICDRDGDNLPRASEYCGGGDCDDGDAAVGEPLGWYRDVDGDSYGAGEAEPSCSQPDGFVDQGGDCDDTDELVNPDGTETCNGYDDDCAGGIDDENIPTWYRDADSDTYGDPEVELVVCDQPDGYVSNNLDCLDTDATANPDGTEVCDDGIDQDCNNIVDDADGSQTWYADVDDDSYGDADNTLDTCVANPEGYVQDATDCDDGNTLVNPSATEVCNDLVDNNCNGEIDSDTVDVPWYRDADEDGYGDEDDSLSDCAPPEGYVEDATDCNDGEALVNPGVSEVCNNSIDDNCDDSPTPCEWSGTVSLADSDAFLQGTTSNMQSGFSIAQAGDVNGDGFEDVLIGAYQANTAFLFFGPVSGTLNVTDADITLTGPSGSWAGIAVTGGCDMNADGTANDIAIGGIYDTAGGSEAGAAWILEGPLSAGSYDLDTVAVKLTGEEGDRAGLGLACADMDSNGADDLAVGAYHASDSTGLVYIVYDPPTSGELSSHVALNGEDANDYAGFSVARAGDLNADGYDDLLVGAYLNDSIDSNAGAIYVVYGPVVESGGLASHVKLTGEAVDNNAGYSLAPAGDLDADGNDDFLVGAYQESSVADSAGAVYVVYGPVTPGSLSTATKLTGEALDDNAGYSLGGGSCDINGDGEFDLVIGARKENTGASQAGAVYVVYGPVTVGSLSTATKLTGVSGSDYAGSALATTDMDNDGFCDVLVGAPSSDLGASDAGVSYVLYGLGY